MVAADPVRRNDVLSSSVADTGAERIGLGFLQHLLSREGAIGQTSIPKINHFALQSGAAEATGELGHCGGSPCQGREPGEHCSTPAAEGAPRGKPTLGRWITAEIGPFHLGVGQGNGPFVHQALTRARSSPVQCNARLVNKRFPDRFSG